MPVGLGKANHARGGLSDDDAVRCSRSAVKAIAANVKLRRPELLSGRDVHRHQGVGIGRVSGSLFARIVARHRKQEHETAVVGG